LFAQHHLYLERARTTSQGRQAGQKLEQTSPIGREVTEKEADWSVASAAEEERERAQI
jgi:hypothetical protein